VPADDAPGDGRAGACVRRGRDGVKFRSPNTIHDKHASCQPGSVMNSVALLTFAIVAGLVWGGLARSSSRPPSARRAGKPEKDRRAVPRRDDLHTILILGSGPIVIGQGCEFDYSGTQAVRALREEGYRVMLVNSNPPRS
jgi:hypothetical protein